MDKISQFVNVGCELCRFVVQGASETGATFAKAISPLGALTVSVLGTVLVAGGIALTAYCVKENRRNKDIHQFLGRPLLPQRNLPPQARMRKAL